MRAILQHVLTAIPNWEFSWPKMSIWPLARQQAVRQVVRAISPPCVESPSEDSNHGTGDQFTPLFRAAPSRMLLPLAGVVHPNQDAAGGRASTSTWGAPGLLGENCCCSIEDCYRQHPAFFLILRLKKNIWCLLPVIHLLKCLCQFSGDRSKITKPRIAQQEKISTKGNWSWKDENLSQLCPSCRALPCQILKAIKEKCLL